MKHNVLHPQDETILMMKLFVLMLYIPINNFSGMTGQFTVFMGWTSTKQKINILLKNSASDEFRTNDPSISSVPLSHYTTRNEIASLS